MNWLIEYWYVAWGLIGGSIFITLWIYAYRHPDGAFGSIWLRLEYAFALGVLASMVLAVLSIPLSLLVPDLLFVQLLFSPYVYGGLYVAAWFVTPHVRRIVPLGGLFAPRTPSNSAPHRDRREASHVGQPSSAPARGRER
jgi:hypothetical protein